MKKLLLLSVLMLSVAVSRAQIVINYSISGGTSGTPWSGQITVFSLESPASDNSYPIGTTISVSANGWDALVFGSSGYFGSTGAWSSSTWVNIDTNCGLYVNSAALYSVIAAGEWTGTWNNVLSGHSYALETASTDVDYPMVYSAQFVDPDHDTLSVVGGGVITFSLAPGGGAVPEPSTYAAIFGLSALGFAAYRKRKQSV